ncbi:MAG: DUF72 domain-containing protein [Calditrichaeota bacterium]|nr:DUF72 domain-containing protein [Calditrichota bacterium]
MNFFVGTSGYSYKEWCGSFYPEKFPAKEMLPFYANQFNAVEINNTFYRFPKKEVLAVWAEQVTDNFRFSIKAPQRITHFIRLKEEAKEQVDYLYQLMPELGNKLGLVLYQLPPNMKKDKERLANFIGYLPDGYRTVFEFRHETWYDEDIYNLLRDHNIALCVNDSEEGDTPMIKTADFTYFRLRRVLYEDKDLQNWYDKMKKETWDDLFVFFKHEDEGTGPKLANRFNKLID